MAPGRVTRLALLDTGARTDTPEQTTRRKDLIDLADRVEFRVVRPRLLTLFVHENLLSDAPPFNDVTQMADSVGKDAFLRQQKAIMGRPDSRPGLSDTRCPSLVVCGRQDALTPFGLSEEIVGLIPGANLILIDDYDHLATIERPDEVNAALKTWMTG